MYNVAVYFDVKPEHRDDFIAAAHEDGRNSAASEPGTRRFELIADETNPNRFYLNEAYDSLAAFELHSNGPHFAKFFEAISSYVEGPTWLIKGNRVDEATPPPATQATREALGILNADHIALRTPDYAGTLAFYTEKLGFTVDVEWTLPAINPDLRCAYLRLGSFKIEVLGDANPQPLPVQKDLADHLAHSGFIHLCLAVENVDKTIAGLKERGVEVFIEPFDLPPIGKRLGLVKDNGGNIIEFAHDIIA
ncbi:antibiotic biosynthesis monooxygenase [Agrobacterium sp. MOPV5]|uniref:VOC family protein n=1 Tax=Agrobacterium leguminum TaxID=2792015 RepID=UPI0018C1E0B2|nr:VOC family protein [Agrobacterium leguminum]MBG0511616.1 antibiotic biosynthesis monooxygenase [Agrobacterium leguminum]